MCRRFSGKKEDEIVDLLLILAKVNLFGFIGLRTFRTPYWIFYENCFSNALQTCEI